jgi:hypothetical protein
MLPDSIRQLSSHRAICKVASVFLAITVLAVWIFGHFSTQGILWMATPMVLLGLTEAGYAGQQRHYEELLKDGKTDERSALLVSESVLASSRRTVEAILSPSIWPFYLALWGTLIGGALNLAPHATFPPMAPIANAAPATGGPKQPVSPGVYSGGPGYPPGMGQRPDATPHFGPIPANSDMPLRTPGLGFPRPVTPVNFGPKLPVRPLGPPPTVYYGKPAPVPGTSPVRQNP